MKNKSASDRWVPFLLGFLVLCVIGQVVVFVYVPTFDQFLKTLITSMFLWFSWSMERSLRRQEEELNRMGEYD